MQDTLDYQSTAISQVCEQFDYRVTTHIKNLIDNSNELGIAKQFIPDIQELDIKSYELADPIADNIKSPIPGLVHRYADRVLIKIINVCPVYCRFCFRKEMLGKKSKSLSFEQFEQCVQYIKSNPQIWEVILTGGDPLYLKPKLLAKYLQHLNQIDTLDIIRIHTRVPTVAPDLVNQELIQALKTSNKTIYIALHANHPAEFTAEAKLAIAKLVDNGIVLVSQSVLLKGINDQYEVLAALMREFVKNRVKPYYLHQLDLARGTSHFRVDVEVGKSLVKKLNKNLSGLCQVRYMLDSPDGTGKVELI